MADVDDKIIRLFLAQRTASTQEVKMITAALILAADGQKHEHGMSIRPKCHRRFLAIPRNSADAVVY